jgi:hypothetical protein
MIGEPAAASMRQAFILKLRDANGPFFARPQRAFAALALKYPPCLVSIPLSILASAKAPPINRRTH